MLSVAHEVGLLTFAATFNLYGLLTKRDDCAHPSDYRPGRIEALQYVAELFGSMSDLQACRSS